MATTVSDLEKLLKGKVGTDSKGTISDETREDFLEALGVEDEKSSKVDSDEDEDKDSSDNSADETAKKIKDRAADTQKVSDASDEAQQKLTQTKIASDLLRTQLEILREAIATVTDTSNSIAQETSQNSKEVWRPS
jgi:hypothetical protein